MKTFFVCYLAFALTAAAIVQWHDANRQPLPVGPPTPEPPVLVCPCGGGCAPDCDCGCQARE
jgi:hypothetical protein